MLPFWKGWHRVQYKDLAEWQTKTGNDKHSIIADPLFTDAAKYNFVPTEKSPAINFVKPRMDQNTPPTASFAASWPRAAATRPTPGSPPDPLRSSRKRNRK